MLRILKWLGDTKETLFSSIRVPVFFGLIEMNKASLKWIDNIDSENIKSTESCFEYPSKPAIDLVNNWEDYFNKDEKKIRGLLQKERRDCKTKHTIT